MMLVNVVKLTGFVLGLAFGFGAHAQEVVKGDGGTVRLLYSEFGSNSFPAKAMKRFELDKKHGIVIELVASVSDKARMSTLQAGGAEVGTLDWADVSRMRNAGVDIVGVSPFLRLGADFSVVPVDSPIKTLGDLKGKKFGVYNRNSLDFVLERAVAKAKYQVDLDKDATIQEGSGPLMWALMDQGQLDATEAFNSVAPAMIATGKYRALAKVSDLVTQLGLPETPYLFYAFNGTWVKTHMQNTRAFVAAYHDVIDLLRTNDQIWIDRGGEMKMPPDVAAAFRKEARGDFLRSFSPAVEANIKTVFDTLLPIAGPGVFGFTEVPKGILSLDYQ
ncbi:MAG: ABC transporter substrate-binding protein [Xanthobacteraceae bacterium]